jgi:hypothetical protein
MDGSYNTFNILQIILVIVFLIIYILAFVVVKPFLLNHKRLISTLSLKITYLIYLGTLLVCMYLFMFYGPSDIEYQVSELAFFGSLICFFIPNLGILFRRHFIKYRNQYNYFFSVFNLVVTIFIVHKLNQQHWFIL